VCPVGSSSVAGLAFQFYTGGPYPPEYDGALFFADYSRDCIWVMHRNGDVLPNPSNIKTFVGGAANPVDLQIGPGGDLFYADFDGGTIRRISFTAQNQPPTAVATATPTSGAAPSDGQLRPHPLERPRPRRHAQLCLGPGRGRGVRRLDVADADVHLHGRWNLHGESRGQRQPGGPRASPRGRSRSETRRQRPRSSRPRRARPGRSAT
jgi:hypothetical protein